MHEDFGTVHVPVMAREVMDALAPAKGRVFVDGTLGGGGHTRMMLDAGARVVGLDQDAGAVARAALWGKPYGDKLQLVQANFSELEDVLASLGVDAVDGILLDLGISSDQLDDPARGLSYQAEGPLDMRLDRAKKLTAGDIVNRWDEKRLAKVLRDYGDEPRASALARAIVHVRKQAPLATTKDLLQVVEEVYPPRFGLKRSHPAARIFQALRVVVNEEMAVLEKVLPVAAGALKAGGALAVITFQAEEDRIVKRVFRGLVQDELDSMGRVAVPAAYKTMPKKMPAKAEVLDNPRARSAHLRVLKRTRA